MAGKWTPLWSKIADVALSVVFWTLWTGLPAALWYFPLWSMGLAGHEASVVLYTAPAVLGIPQVRHWVQRNLGWMHLMSLVGLLSFAIASPQNRLLGTGIGVAFTSTAWFAQMLLTYDGSKMSWTVGAWLLGLLMTNIVKYMGYSSNPFWTIKHGPSGGWNVFGIIIGLIASIEAIQHPRRGTDGKKELPVIQQSAFLTGTGLAGILFSFMCLAVDFGIVIRWSTEGHPWPAPEPALWSIVTMASMMLGMKMSTEGAEVENLVVSNRWWAFGSTMVMLLYFLEIPYLAYVCGLAYLTWLFSVAPRVIAAALGQAGSNKLGTTLVVSNLWFMLMLFGSVWPVAYEFVPGGVYMRERTWILVIMTQLMVLCGLQSARLSKPRPSAVVPDLTKFARRLVGFLLLAMVFRMVQWDPPQPFHPDERLLTGGIWTVHFGLDQDGYESHRRMAALIQELELDVVGLLESDLTRIIMGNRDMSQYLGETMNYYVDYGPNPLKHTWGCTLLSKFPIVRSEHHMLPSPVGELACAIHATLDVYGREVDVIVSHNGQEENLEDRRLQTAMLAQISRTSNNPLLFLGYVVTKPGKEHEIYKRLIVDGGLKDIDPTDWDRWCEYIAYKGLDRIGYARVSHGGITDTEMQVGKFVVPARASDLKAVKSAVCRETEYAESMRFPPQFMGKGERGHKYHVFGQPRYYCEQ